MSRYEYANGKLKTLSSRLLSAADLEELRELASMEDLLKRLGNTDYQRDLYRALESSGGVTAISDACRRAMVSAGRNVSTFYDADGQRVLDTVSMRFDIHNLRAILRGQMERQPFNAIVEQLVPAGYLDETMLRRLASHIDIRATVQTLSTMHAAYGRAGKDAIAAFQATNDWMAAEATFESHLYLALFGRTARGSDNDRVAATFLAGEIDARNIAAALRLRAGRRVLDETELQRRMVLGGTVDAKKLAAIAGAPADRAVRTLLGTIEVSSGAEFVLSDTLAESVNGQLLRWGAAFLHRDAQTVAPAIGYVEAKRLEALAILRIAKEIATLRGRDLFAERLKEVS